MYDRSNAFLRHRPCQQITHYGNRFLNNLFGWTYEGVLGVDRPFTSVGISQRALCRTSTVLLRSLCAALFSLTGRPSSDYSFYASVATTRLRPDRLRLPYRRVTTFLSSFPFTAPHLLFYFITLLHLNCFLPPLPSSPHPLADPRSDTYPSGIQVSPPWLK